MRSIRRNTKSHLILSLLFMGLLTPLPGGAAETSWGPPSEALKPKVTGFKGQVIIVAAEDNTKQRPPKKDEVLALNEKIVTGGDSSITIQFGKETQIQLEGNSQIQISHLKQKGKNNQTQVTLQKGAALVQVKYPKDSRSRFAVITEPAIFTTQKSRFKVSFNPQKGESIIEVKKGYVNFDPANHDKYPLFLSKGQRFHVSEKDYGYIRK